MESSAGETEEGGALVAGGLRLEFVRQGDRLAHSLFADRSPDRPLLSSVEGDSEEIWPPSPPFQSLSIEKGTDGHERAFLVGMAGTSHWSASIEPGPGPDEWIFDLACRAKELPKLLQCCYAAGGDGHWEVKSARNQATLWLDEDAPALEIESRLAGTALSIDTPGWLVISADLPDGKWPQTIRWKFCARLLR